MSGSVPALKLAMGSFQAVVTAAGRAVADTEAVGGALKSSGRSERRRQAAILNRSGQSAVAVLKIQSGRAERGREVGQLRSPRLYRRCTGTLALLKCLCPVAQPRAIAIGKINDFSIFPFLILLSFGAGRLLPVKFLGGALKSSSLLVRASDVGFGKRKPTA